MQTPIKTLMIFGTRPEAIKMAPLALALASNPEFELKICVTGQHRKMLDQVLNLFGIIPDHDLEVMTENQTLNGLMARILLSLDPIIELEKPNWIIVHGDTTTSLASGLAAFHRRVPVAHVEAGLRTFNLDHPWPEELNRSIVDQFSELMFAPTHQSRLNLERSGLNGRRVFVTGNTVIDALKWTLNKIETDRSLEKALSEQYGFIDSSRKVLLVTGHRRENFGKGFHEICRALSQLATREDLQIVYPVHLNPNVQGPVTSMLGEKRNVHLINPVDYLSFVWLMKKANIILTDSGGVQEEAPTLGKPVLVMRETTERPEAVNAGTVKLVGANAGNILSSVTRLLDDEEYYEGFSRAHNPYGDGKSVSRIVSALKGINFEEYH